MENDPLMLLLAAFNSLRGLIQGPSFMRAACWELFSSSNSFLFVVAHNMASCFFRVSKRENLRVLARWAVKKAECRRTDAFEPWCWRRLLRVPWTARRSNQSILKEISPGCSLEGLMLKLKLQYFGHFMQRVDSLEKTLMLGGIGGRRRRG